MRWDGDWKGEYWAGRGKSNCIAKLLAPKEIQKIIIVHTIYIKITLAAASTAHRPIPP